jgi:hypothetical protein
LRDGVAEGRDGNGFTGGQEAVAQAVTAPRLAATATVKRRS